MKKIRKRERIDSSPPEGQRSSWVEWQVAEGSKVIGRYDTQAQARHEHPDAEIETHVIELRKIEPTKDRKWIDRGARAIFVDGEQWGELVPEPNGMHGTHYSFTDAHGSALEYNAWKERRTKEWARRPIRVKSDKSEHGRASRRPDGYKSVMERVLERIQQAIADGDFKSPAQLKREAEEANAQFREQQERSAAEEAAKFTVKADEVLKALHWQRGADERRALIVAAMRWAQTQ